MALMLASAALAWALRPHISMANQQTKVELATLVPTRFGDWQELTQSTGQIVNPQQTAELEKLYSQTLSRTYVHTTGRKIMLSLAYGGDQSHDNQIHKPEVCYPAQGFRIISRSKNQISSISGDIPVMRLVTQLGPRSEPVTYWIRVGDNLVRGAIEQNLARVGYGLKGQIPDGILFRVSEISLDVDKSFALQELFVSELLQAMPADTRKVFVGERRSS